MNKQPLEAIIMVNGKPVRPRRSAKVIERIGLFSGALRRPRRFGESNGNVTVYANELGCLVMRQDGKFITFNPEDSDWVIRAILKAKAAFKKAGAAS